MSCNIVSEYAKHNQQHRQGAPMELSNAERLVLIMLSDLYKKLGVKGEIDPDFVQSAIFSSNLWGFRAIQF